MRNVETWKSVVIWSIISAAFIGPGSVTTAVAAGSLFKLSLMWSVVFATVACVLLQEVAARITIASGLNLGQALKKKFPGSFTSIQWIVGGSVVAGCAAYEAGNIMGAVSGLALMTSANTKVLTVLVTAAAFFVMWKRNPQWIYNLMAILVAVMGVAFLLLAAVQKFSWLDLLEGSVVPAIPPGSELLVLGMVGTTVVPYNFFLGSDVSQGQTVGFMRVGLIISVVVGGLITAWILIAGLAVADFSSFPALYGEFDSKVGTVGAIAMALGLAAAGFASAITSPFASGVIARSVFEVKHERWAAAVWMLVLLTGFLFGISGLQPVSVIVVVQALNGLILPLLTIFLMLVINDDDIIPAPFRHGLAYNLALLVVLFAVLYIGFKNIEDIAVKNLHATGSYRFVTLGAAVAVSLLTASRVLQSKK